MNQYLRGFHQNKIFCVTSISSIGCTFLEWSIHWLLGTSNYLHEFKKTLPLVDTPLTKLNAHLHVKNHPAGFNKTKKTVDILKSNFSNDWKSLYPQKMYIDDALKKLNYNVDKLSDLSTEEWAKVEDVIADDYCNLWDYFYKENIPRIFLYLDPVDILYRTSSIRSFDRQIIKHEPYLNEDELLDDFYYHFFSDSVNIYNGNALSELTVWDKRELLALNLRPYNAVNCTSGLDFTTPHKFINTKQLWHNGEETLLEIVDYLGESIVKSRLLHWREVYKQWQELQLTILKFVYDVDHIVNSIINNYYYDLSPYHLTLQQEAIIQHILIYKHKLTIKNWQLEKFPNNTQALHCLLEPAFYNVENIYNI
jgi:hypothetical protein